MTTGAGIAPEAISARASAVLPDVVDLHQDRDVLFSLDLPKDLDAAIDRLGGSPW